MNEKEIRLIYHDGVSYVIEKCPGEHDIDKRRSWIQSQISQGETSLNETSQNETSQISSSNEIQKIIHMSLFWLHSNMKY